MLSSIQKKLYKGYGKVANKLGEEYEIFRSLATSDPLTDDSYIDTKKVAFSQDNGFSKPHRTGVSIWTCWIDGRLDDLFDIQQGDYLKALDSGAIYLIASAQLHLPVEAIKMLSTLSVTNGNGYSDTGTGFGPTETDVVTDVPCYIEQTGSGAESAGYVPNGDLAGVEASWTIYLHDPESLIKNGFIVTDSEGNRGQVKRVYKSDIGTRLIVEET